MKVIIIKKPVPMNCVYKITDTAVSYQLYQQQIDDLRIYKVNIGAER